MSNTYYYTIWLNNANTVKVTKVINRLNELNSSYNYATTLKNHKSYLKISDKDIAMKINTYLFS